MTELTQRELDSISSHLKKVSAIQRQNDDSNEEVALDIPERISLDRTANGLTLGHIEYSEKHEEYVFVPVGAREAPKWTVPIPPPFN